MGAWSLDKTKCWFGFGGDGIVHCFLGRHRLCDSAEATPTTASVVTQVERGVCPRCYERFKTATHEKRAAHYGS